MDGIRITALRAWTAGHGAGAVLAVFFRPRPAPGVRCAERVTHPSTGDRREPGTLRRNDSLDGSLNRRPPKAGGARHGNGACNDNAHRPSPGAEGLARPASGSLRDVAERTRGSRSEGGGPSGADDPIPRTARRTRLSATSETAARLRSERSAVGCRLGVISSRSLHGCAVAGRHASGLTTEDVRTQHFQVHATGRRDTPDAPLADGRRTDVAQTGDLSRATQSIDDRGIVHGGEVLGTPIANAIDIPTATPVRLS